LNTAEDIEVLAESLAGALIEPRRGRASGDGAQIDGADTAAGATERAGATGQGTPPR
jgi:hypothetical protein